MPASHLRICLLAAAICVSPCAGGQPAAGVPDALTVDGGLYFGPLRNGKLHGKGRMQWRNGARYEGAFVAGLMHGKGTLHYANGDIYEGQFADGDYHGQGVFTNTEGERYAGRFQRGEFTGEGVHASRDGSRYEGHFVKWRWRGKGRVVGPDGTIYEGGFPEGELSGPAKVTYKDGRRYEGELQHGQFHGQGTLLLANGDEYRGGFAHGMYEGSGTLKYASPRADGRIEESGIWRFGRLNAEAERRQAQVGVEQALYGQRALLDHALAALAPRAPGRINLYLLAIAGDGSQEVFRREVEFVRQQFDATFDTRGRSIALVNSRSTIASAPMATLTSVREALGAIASRMDLEQDILFLFITSHGSADHELTLNQAGMSLRGLKAGELAEALRASGIRWKAVVVSACYAGGFIDYLKDERSLVLAAARHDRRSFGCADENDFTYFGRAFFKDALPSSGSFQDAFQAADSLIREREGKELKGSEDAHSLPQMHDAPAIREHLQRWWAQRATRP
jgi:hypothetical protein